LVVGVDVSETKVKLVNSGKSTVVEADIGPLVAEHVLSGRLRATTDCAEAVGVTSISLICVGTPSRSNGDIDVSHVVRVAEQIGEALGTKLERHVVVVRSTVPPGTMAEIVIPALERYSRRRVGDDLLGLAVNPEFLREGTSVRDFFEPPFTLVGASDLVTASEVAALYAGIAAPLHQTDLGVAETVKYACNAFHGLKVAFANEIGSICGSLGIDSHDVMRLFCADTKLNISASYLRPGFAFGGSCLPKDLRALAYRARSSDVRTPLLEAALESNRCHIERAFKLITADGRRDIGMLGIAFKSGTDDLRESPLVALLEMLVGKGYRVSVYDREVSEAELIGANREYIEREIPHIWSMLRSSPLEVLARADVVVLGHATQEIRDLEERLRPGQVVVDLVRAFGARRSDGVGYRGLGW
jgi:GDP-mannose 6-dehydrogenase